MKIFSLHGMLEFSLYCDLPLFFFLKYLSKTLYVNNCRLCFIFKIYKFIFLHTNILHLSYANVRSFVCLINDDDIHIFYNPLQRSYVCPACTSMWLQVYGGLLRNWSILAALEMNTIPWHPQCILSARLCHPLLPLLLRHCCRSLFVTLTTVTSPFHHRYQQ